MPVKMVDIPVAVHAFMHVSHSTSLPFLICMKNQVKDSRCEGKEAEGKL